MFIMPVRAGAHTHACKSILRHNISSRATPGTAASIYIYIYMKKVSKENHESNQSFIPTSFALQLLQRNDTQGVNMAIYIQTERTLWISEVTPGLILSRVRCVRCRLRGEGGPPGTSLHSRESGSCSTPFNVTCPLVDVVVCCYVQSFDDLSLLFG